MIQIIHPGCRFGTITAPLSKSHLHRQLICAALSDTESSIFCNSLSDDILTTIQCLNAMGAKIQYEHSKQINISPLDKKLFRDNIVLDCRESGTTLRFLLPVISALGLTVNFYMSERLAQRPIQPLIDVLNQHGVQIIKTKNILSCKGQLYSGIFIIPGNISSQFISGLLFSLPLLENDSQIIITDEIQSQPYITMTEEFLIHSGIRFTKDCHHYHLPGKQNYLVAGDHQVEKDWSNAAVFLCMGALSLKGITVKGLNIHSTQGDKKILEILQNFGAALNIEDDQITVKNNYLKAQIINALDIPDVIPAISALAACSNGTTRIINAERLRQKESNRLKSICAMLTSLGADLFETPDGLLIHGKHQLIGGTCQSFNDHRIAMAAAIVGCHAQNEVILKNAEAIQKSYPNFWNDYHSLKID